MDFAQQLGEIYAAHRQGEHEVLPNAPVGYCRDCSRQIRKALAEAAKKQPRRMVREAPVDFYVRNESKEAG